METASIIFFFGFFILVTIAGLARKFDADKLSTIVWIITGIFSVIMTIICWTMYCNEERARTAEWHREIQEREDKEQRHNKEMAERVVELSFMDFLLGQPMSACLNKAKRNKDIKIQEINKDKDQTNIIFATKLKGRDVTCTVRSFQDTIAFLVILSKEYELSNIDNMYEEKYGQAKSFAYGDSKGWDFKNSAIQFVRHTHTKERLVPKKGREHLNLENIENKYDIVRDIYFDMISITYSDKRQVAKEEQYIYIEKQRLDSVNSIKNRIRTDSLNTIQNEAKNKTLNAI